MPDDVAEYCAARCHVSPSAYAHLRDDYVHTWRGDEAVAGAALETSWHLPRDSNVGLSWPLYISLESHVESASRADEADRRSLPPAYTGPPTTEGLLAAICDLISAERRPSVCSKQTGALRE